MPCLLYETLGPVWLGKLRAGRRLRSRIHGYQRTFLPLEQISCSKDIFTLFVELYRSLDALVRFARVELSDKFRIIDAVDIGCCLLKHLPYRESLRHVGTDTIGGAAVEPWSGPAVAIIACGL